MKYLLGFCFVFVICVSIHAQSTRATKGILDLREHSFSENGNVHLNGEWEIYMSELISPELLIKPGNRAKDLVDFPSTWNENSKSLKPGKGFATYHLTLLVKPQELGIEIPHFYSSYRFWINGKEVASNGQVASSEEKAIPQWRPQSIVYRATKDTLHLVIQASNFHHAKGGIREDVVMGLPDEIMFKRQIAVTSNIALAGALFVLSVAFIVLCLFIKINAAALYFAAMAFTWTVRALFTNLYIITYHFPDFPWEVCVKLEYVSLYLAMIWAILFLASLFPEDVNNLFKYFFVGCNSIFVVATIFTDASLYTQFLPVYLSFTCILLLYVIYVLIQAVVKEREGVWLVLSCTMLGVVVFAYDLIAYQGLAFFSPIITNFAYLLMFLLMGGALVHQFGFLKRRSNRDVLTYEDLYGTTRK